MQAFINRNYIRILVVALTSCLNLSIYAEQALSGGGETTQPTPQSITQPTTSIDNAVVSPPIQNSGSSSVTSPTLIQTGANNVANVNSSTATLNYPSCNGTCAFAIMRTSTSNNSNGSFGNQYEAVIGIIHSFNSPDQTNAETNRLMIEIQKYKSEYEIVAALSDKLAEAIETSKYERANLIAIILAPKLGKTHLQLLQEVRLKPSPK